LRLIARYFPGAWTCK